MNAAMIGGECSATNKGTNASALRVFAILFLALVPVLASGAMVLGILELPNTGHADKYHPEAISVRQAMRNGKCMTTQTHYSAHLGTVLILCQLAGDSWAGQVARVTMNNGSVFLGDKCYECTLFVANWRYWSHVLVRDKYDVAPPDLLVKLDLFIHGGV
jgi:hypothetical protein